MPTGHSISRTVNCKQCHTIFYSDVPGKKFCSKSCKIIFGKTLPNRKNYYIEKSCMFCKSLFKTYKYDNSKTCSRKCRAQLFSQTQLPKYYEQLKHKLTSVEFLCTPNEYKGTENYKKYLFKCKKCTVEFTDYIDVGNIPQCPVCFPKNNVSTMELEMKQFLDELKVKYIHHDRTTISPLEIDFYLPEYNLGIELHGIYWHGEQQGKIKTYHLNKTSICESKNIRLLQIWENEWNIKQEIVKSIIKITLDKSVQRIYARQCKIIDVTHSDAKQFLINNHLQQNCNASSRLGLVYKGELVSLMTFGKSRFTKSQSWELLRFCNKLNYSVVGGASRLFKHFIKTTLPTNIISYSDRRYFTGAMYKSLGMIFELNTSPNYFYFKNNSKLYSRLKFQKHKLSNTLHIFDPDKTEWENMQTNGYDRIWDCGHSRWIWSKI